LSEWFRIRHGKIVEHWDMARKIGEGERAL